MGTGRSSLRRRAPLLAFAALAALAATVAPSASADEPFTEAIARRLLPEAAALEMPAAFNVMRSLGSRLRPDDLRVSSVALPYVALLVSRQQFPPGADGDFRFEPGVDLDAYARAMGGGAVELPLKRDVKGLTLLRPEFLTKVTTKQDGSKASGEVEFAAPGAYRGRVRFEALLAAGTWHVTAFEFPTGGTRIRWSRGGWREARLPLATPPLTLPIVTAARPVPPREHSVAIFVTPRDGLFIDGREQTSLGELKATLRRAAEERPRAADGSSRMDAVIVGDDGTPWAAIQWILMSLADASVLIDRVHFAVQHRASGETGVLTTFLPKDGKRSTPQLVDAPPPTLRINAFTRSDAQPTTPEAVYAHVKARAATDPGLKVVFDAPLPLGGGVPHGTMMRIVDAIRRAGAREVIFGGTPMPQPSDRNRTLRELIAAAAAPERNVSYVTIDGADVPPAAPGTAIPDGPSPSALAAKGVGDDPAGSVTAAGDENDNGIIGLGGGAGGAFKGRGSHRNLRSGKRDANALKTEDAVALALGWLAAHQSADGGWDAEGFAQWCDGKIVEGPRADGAGKRQYAVGVTGLAILAFLGAGYTNRSDGPFGKVVANGLRFLRSAQDADGCIGPRTTFHFPYNHAIGALALLEAFRRTGSTNYKAPSQKAVEFILASRNPQGGWRYGVQPGDDDTSVTAWMMMALESASQSNADAAASKQPGPAPFSIDPEAVNGIRTWMDKATDPETGRVGYQQPGTGPARTVELLDKFPGEKSESMTAAAIASRVFLGEDPKSSDVIKKGAALIAALPPVWNPNDGSIDMDYWYFGTLALFHVGGDAWKTWEAGVKPAMVATQRGDGEPCDVKGSWDPIDPWGPDGGRVYATAIMAMTLEVASRNHWAFGVAAPR